MSEKKVSRVMAVIYLIVAACIVVGIVLFTNQGEQSKSTITVDGYMGPMTVEVSIKDGKISGAVVTESTAGEFLPQSEEIIFAQAIANGNADNIDVVAGATGTSKALITAMQEAQVAAGIGENVYTATADGRAGPISIAVTIIDGKITGAIVTDYPTGERIPESADTIIAKAIENGHPNEIDVVAGASMTSRGLISALQEAYIKANTDVHSMVGYGEGYKGPLSVLITTEGETIVSAELLTISDSTFSLPTAETLLEQAVANGSADNLDVIAGATATSNGIITALQDAMSK